MIIQKAYAKLNFNLHVLPQLLPNGYHQVKLLNLQANLADKITIQESAVGIKLICNNPDLPVNETNLAYKAAKIVMGKYHSRGGIKITLEKHTPITSGLGGGSADAAAVILALDKLWKLNLTDYQKIDLGKRLGMDVCYCVIGGICMLRGAGEIVEPIQATFPNINLIIITPNIKKPSSAWSFARLDLTKVGQHLEKLDKLIKAIKQRDLLALAQNLHNDFEKSMLAEFPEIAEIKAKMKKNGAWGTNLCGAGLSVFGIWPNQKSADAAFKKLRKIYHQTFLCQTI